MLAGALLVSGAGGYTVYALGARGRSLLPTPSIRVKPAKATGQTSAKFAYTDARRGVSFQCSLDHARFSRCATAIRYRGPLQAGNHRFRVRAVRRVRHRRVLSPTASYRWLVAPQSPAPSLTSHPSDTTGSTDPTLSESLSISVGQVAGLYPGGVPREIPVTLANPNDHAIFVTSVAATASGGPPGCDSARNLSLTQSSASDLAPVVIQAHGSVALPAQGATAPTIRLLNLPVNQDACRSASFALNVTGGGHA
jgi:hypothetical protein